MKHLIVIAGVLGALIGAGAALERTPSARAGGAGAKPTRADGSWGSWVEKKSGFCTVRAQGDDAPELDKAADVLAAFHADFLKLSGMTDGDFAASAVTVNLYPPGTPEGRLGYASMSGGPTRGSDGKGKLGYRATVTMPGPAAHNGSVASSSGHPQDSNYFEKLLIHEIAPVYFEMYARARGGGSHTGTPKWFEQGLKEYFAVFHSTPYWKTEGAEFYFRACRETHGVDVDFGVNVGDGCNDGLIVCKFIADEFGEAALLRVLASRETTFGKRLHAAVGVEFGQFTKRLGAWIQKTNGEI